MKTENKDIVKKYFKKYFKNQFYKESDLEFISFVKILNKKDKHNRSELLKAFYAYIDDKWALGMLTDKVDEMIKGFEKSL